VLLAHMPHRIAGPKTIAKLCLRHYTSGPNIAPRGPTAARNPLHEDWSGHIACLGRGGDEPATLLR